MTIAEHMVADDAALAQVVQLALQAPM